MVLPHQTTALSMVQEWWYQVRSNRFSELRHRGSLIQAPPHIPPISQCLQKITLTLSPKSSTQVKQASKAEALRKAERKNRHAGRFPQQTLPHQQFFWRGMSQAAFNSLKTSKICSKWWVCSYRKKNLISFCFEVSQLSLFQNWCKKILLLSLRKY